MEYKLNLPGCYLKRKGCSGIKIKKLNTFDWLSDLPQAQEATDWVEVQFKNTRKGYYLNSNKIPLEKGDIIAVESSPGHDIGEVTLVGALVLKQMKKTHYRFDSQEVKRVYRKARPVDMEKFQEAKGLEHDTMLRSRKIAENLKLNMKIGDVEYQGDGNKAIFYYIADDRVDFRQLIKVLAETFKVRIEMKQIGARQEAGRIGGVGPCGRELCCSSWMTNFVSVSTSAARYQDLSMNPQKLAGQCAKLKCCLNYETDTYAEAQRDFPSKDVILETKDGSFYQVKADYFKRTITYSTSKDFIANAVVLSVERTKQVISANRKGIKVDNLAEVKESEPVKSEFGDILGQDALNRFDKNGKPNRNKKKNRNGKPERPERPEPNAPREVNTTPKNQTNRNQQGQNGQGQGKQGAPRNAAQGNRQEQAGKEKPKGDHQQKSKKRFEKPQKINPSNNDQSPKA
jgi:cell fate regulator YaaT (PSP1 superfamily)